MQRPQFGNAGLLGSLSKWVTWIESSPTKELMVLDVGAMVAPRTAIEYFNRGPDMARETLIRESLGTVTNVFMAGAMGAAMGWLYSRAPFINPKAMLGEAFINLQNMQAYSGLAQQALFAHKDQLHQLSLKDLRQQMVAGFVDAIEDGLQHGVPSTLADAFGLKGEAALSKAGAWIDTSPEAVATRDKARNALLGLFEPGHEAQTGLLDIETLLAKTHGDDLPKLAELEAKKLAGTKLSKPEAQTLETLSQAVAKTRKTYSQLALKSEELIWPQMEKHLDALNLSEKLTLKGVQPHWLDENLLGNLAESKPLHLSGRNAQDLILQYKRFLEQSFDRSVAELARTHAPRKLLNGAVNHHLPLTELLGKNADESLKIITGAMVGQSKPWWQPQHWLDNLLPKLDDGMLAYMGKQKWWVTGVALGTTLAASVGVTYLNAWITQQKNGGKNYFPGDELPKHPDQATLLPTTTDASAMASSPTKAQPAKPKEFYSLPEPAGNLANPFLPLAASILAQQTLPPSPFAVGGNQ